MKDLPEKFRFMRRGNRAPETLAREFEAFKEAALQ